MNSQANPTFSELEQAATALGIGVDVRKQRIEIATARDPKSKSAAVYTALAPLFRQIAEQYVGSDGVRTSKSGLAVLETDFTALVSAQLIDSRGAPSLFKQCCSALELTAEDAPWLLHIAIVSVLQGIVRKYTEHLANDESADRKEDTTESGDVEQTALAVKFVALGWVVPAADQGEVHELSNIAIGRALGQAKWQSHIQAVQHIWQNLSLAITLKRGEPATSDWIERALGQTARPKRRTRIAALALVKQSAAALGKKVDAQSPLAEDDAAGQYERRSVEFCAVLLDLTLAVLAKARTPPFVLTENDKRDVRRLQPSEKLLRSLARIEYGVRLADPAGPLLNKPKTWSTKGDSADRLASGGLHHRKLGFYKFPAKNKPIRDFLRQMSEDTHAFERVFEAVNALQNTSWRINKRVWEVQQAIVKASDDADVLDTGLGASFDNIALPTSIASKWKPWLEGSFFARSGRGSGKSVIQKFGDKNLASPGWRLVSPAGAPEIARLADRAQFFFAYNIDSRGRIYPIGSYLHPQSEDTFRALLEFGTEQPITDAGVGWLALHGSQCASRIRILADLGIAGGGSPTLKQRVQWVALMSDLICESAQEPLECTWWREVGGKTAFQFLAFCFAWHDYKTLGSMAKCSLPIHLDGTCNGLQHIAALTKDETMAKAVNILPGEPNDIYLSVAEAVQKQASNGKRRIVQKPEGNKPFEQSLHEFEPELRALVGKHPDLLSREAAKTVVMVIPYGASVRTYASELASHIAQYSSDKALLSALTRMGQVASRRIAEAADQPKKKRESATASSVRAALPKHASDDSWKPAYYGRLLLSTLLAREFDLALSEQYPAIGRFKTWLHGVAKAVTDRGLPVAWVSPSGLPVLQNGFKTNVEQIDIKGLARIRMSRYVLNDDVDINRQLRGILPNYIHSLDSAHLVETVTLARGEGVRSFSMIHDSFGTHVAHMPALASALRVAFVQIYQVDRLKELHEFIHRLLGNAPLSRLSEDPRDLTKARLIALLNSWFSMPTIPRLEPLREMQGVGTLDIRKVQESEYFFC